MSRSCCPSLIVLFTLVALNTGCVTSPRSEPQWPRALPYVIRLELPETAGDKADSPGLRVDRQRTLERLTSRAQLLGVCTELRLSASGTKESDDVDLVLRMREQSRPDFAFTGRNAWFLPSTLLWFGLGFPSFWIADREYQISWDVDFELLRPHTRSPPIVFRENLRERLTLDLISRGWTATVLYTPPAFYEGPRTQNALTERVEAWLLERLVSAIERIGDGMAGDVDIRVVRPRNFETLARERVLVGFEIRSATPLEAMRVRIDGAESWLLTRLDMPAPYSQLDDGKLLYRFKRHFAMQPGTHRIRVEAAHSGKTESTRSPTSAGFLWSASQTIQFETLAP